MEEKLRFVFEYERDERTMGELCAQFGICRDTGYVWLRRYREQGVKGLAELNRASRQHSNQTDAAIERAVLDLREAHMGWGPRKLKRILERDQPGSVWPAASTIGELVKRAGLVVPRRKRRRTEPYTQPLAHAGEANRVWCADFKGWFKAGDGARIDPLTITDAWSRYLLRAQAVEKTDTERVRAIFTHHALGDADPRAVDENTRRPMRGFRLCDRSLGGGGIRDVAGDGDAADGLCDRLRGSHVQVENRHPRALGGERFRRRPPQPRSAPRNYRRRAFDFHGHVLLRYFNIRHCERSEAIHLSMIRSVDALSAPIA